MMGAMLKNRARFYLSFNYFGTLYFCLKTKEFELKNLIITA